MHRRTFRSTTAATLAVLGLALAGTGCSSDGSDGAATTAPPATTTAAGGAATTTGEGGTATTTGEGGTATTAPAVTTTAAPTTTAPSGGAAPTGDPEVVELFTDLRTEHCTEPTPEPIGTEVTPDGQLVMVDNEGNRLVVDLDEQVVYGLDGPDGELPAAYSFGCDPDVFVGTLPN